MNKNSPFSTLSKEDQNRVIEWCGQHTYAKVVELAALPRPEGLAFKTSISAVQRFYAQHNPRTEDTIISRQLAEVLKTQHLDDPDTFRTAALALVEQAIFRSLAEGATIHELLKEFRVLFALHRLRIQDRKERAAQKQEPAFTPEEVISLASRLAPKTTAERPVHTPPPPQPTAPPAPKPTPPPGIHIPPSLASTLAGFDPAPVPHLPSFLTPKPGKTIPFPAKTPGNPAFPANPATTAK